jgi:carboxylesterase type B
MVRSANDWIQLQCLSLGLTSVQASNRQNEQIFNEFLSYAGVSTLDEARQLPYHKVLQANTNQIANAKYGQYVYGPVVDGDFVPALPGVLLLHGEFAKDLNIMVGHNADEVSLTWQTLADAIVVDLFQGTSLYEPICSDQRRLQKSHTDSLPINSRLSKRRELYCRCAIPASL